MQQNPRSRGGAASKAIAGTLASVLAVGMIPAVALADEAPEVQDEASLELLANYAESFAASQVTLRDVTTGQTYTAVNGDTIKIAADSKAHQLVITGMGLPTAETGKYDYDVLKAGVDYKDTTDSANYNDVYGAVNPTFTSTYHVKAVAESTGVYNGATAVDVTVSIAAESLTGVYAYEINADNPEDLSDVTFEFDGTSFSGNIKADYSAAEATDTITDSRIGFAKDGKTYELGTGAGKYSVVYAAVGAAAPTYASGQKVISGVDVREVGTYVAYLFASDSAAGAKPVTSLDFKVSQLDLSKAEIKLTDNSTAPTLENVTINGINLAPAAKAENTASADADKKAYAIATSIASHLKGYTAATSGSTAPTLDALEIIPEKSADAEGVKQYGYQNAPGTYTFKIEPATNDKVVIGSAEGVINIAATDLSSVDADWTYGGTEFDDLGGTGARKLTVNLTTGQSYNEANIAVYSATNVKVPATQYKVTYKNTDTKADVEASALADPGKYKVTVTIDAAATEYKLSGTQSFDVVVTRGTVDKATGLFVNYKGKTTEDIDAVFDGNDVIKDTTVTIKDTDGRVLTAGTDYTVAYTDRTTGKEVTEIVDAGQYDLTITGVGYTIGSAEKVVIPIDVTPLAIAATDIRLAGDPEFISYTGEEYKPTFEYVANRAELNAGTTKTKVWKELPAEAYTLTVKNGTKIAAIKDKGTYDISLVDASNKDNYTIANFAKTIKVEDDATHRNFSDVPTTAWFASAVDTADTAGYMHGYAGTDLFGPYDKLTRGQTAIILYNIAGGNQVETDGFTKDGGYMYTTKFTDVDPAAYYAEAIKWASTRNIVTGYNDTTFGPEDSITREQFAVMLSRYEAAVNGSATGDASLDAYADANAVDAWAKNAVTWAVSKKIMGKDTTVLNPLGDITRAEAAAMV